MISAIPPTTDILSYLVILTYCKFAISIIIRGDGISNLDRLLSMMAYFSFILKDALNLFYSYTTSRVFFLETVFDVSTNRPYYYINYPALKLLSLFVTIHNSTFNNKWPETFDARTYDETIFWAQRELAYDTLCCTPIWCVGETGV